MNRKEVILFLLIALFYFLSVNSLFYTGGDNAHYLILAKSLSEGKGYSDINIPSHPAETSYPPVFPLLLSPLVKFFGFSPFPPKILIILLALSAFWILKKISPPDSFYARWLPYLVILNPLIMGYSGVILSEIPYLFFSLLSIYWIKRDNWNIAVLFLVLALFTRLIGISLLTAFIIYGVRKKKLSFLHWIIPLSLLLLWMLRGHWVGTEGGYMGNLFLVNPYNPGEGYLGLKSLAGRILLNTGAYALRDIPATFYPSLFSDISLEYFRKIYLLLMGIGLTITVFTFRGWWKVFREKQDIISFYVPVYFAILFLWPWKGSRFLVPIIPFLVYYLYIGIKNLAGKKILLSFLLFTFAFYLIQDIKLVQERRKAVYAPEWASYFRAGVWIKENTPSGVITSTRNPFLFYLFSEREGIGIPLKNPAEIRKEFQKTGVDYIIVPPTLEGVKKNQDVLKNFLYPFLERYRNELEKVRALGTPPAYIYRIKQNNSP